MDERQQATPHWAWSPEHRQICRVIETEELWGQSVSRVWLPNSDAIVRMPTAHLRPLNECDLMSENLLVYLSAAARVAEALTQDVLIAPIGLSLLLLPHQLRVLSQAISGDRIRYLLADEVGLGKTIEAGLIMRELKLRGLVERTLVIAPRGLVTQWVAEMRTHFNEEFRPLIPSDFSAYRKIASEENLWESHPQVVCPMDSVKPVERRRGWTADEIARYNRERFEDLISAGWDLIIVDEAHRLAGSTEQVARYKLGRALAEAAPYLLLLSATPHQGKSDAFHRLMTLLDTEAFPDLDSVTRDRVRPYVLRTEKRQAIDANGKPLFKPRRTELVRVAWKERHGLQKLLYESVTEYVRQGYNQAVREKRSYIGFLMILMQRLVVSSTRAIRTSLERRLEVLEAPEEQLTLFSLVSQEDWADMDGQEQMETLLKSQLKGLQNEHAEVKLLLETARQCEQMGADAKAEALLELIYKLQAEEGDPDLKILIFTEFIPTQQMLYEFLTERGFSVVCLNGSMDMEERKQVEEAFSKESRILISTETGGEGLNLQFCHVVINYDIPWNPMRLEQRIGRVDRIGQTHVVRAVNLVLEESVERRVLEVLQEKLKIILDEFGIDKTGDVLDSGQASRLFDELYIRSILNPEDLNRSIEDVIQELRDQARQARNAASVLGSMEGLSAADVQNVVAHPLPYWVERMTVSWLNHCRDHGSADSKIKPGAEIVAKEGIHKIWRLTWPDGFEHEACFTDSASRVPRVGLEEPRIRGLLQSIPMFVPGQSIAVILLPGLAKDIRGYWSLWEISISGGTTSMRSQDSQAGKTVHSQGIHRRKIMPLFVTDDGRVLVPTARHIWDLLLTATPKLVGYLDLTTSQNAFDAIRNKAELQGESIYRELLNRYEEALRQQREKMEFAFVARRKAIERIGLPQVRNHRLRLLEQQEQLAKAQLQRQAQALPEMTPLMIVRVEGDIPKN